MSTVECPSCGCKLRATADLQGAAVQCPRCRTTFTSPLPALPVEEVVEEPMEAVGESLGPPIRGLPPAPKPLKPVLLSSTTAEQGPDDTLTAPGVRQRLCPVCGNRDSEGVTSCTVCGTELAEKTPEPRLPTRRDYEPDRGQLISVLGTFSVLCGLPGLFGICFWPFTIPSVLATGLGIATMVMSHHDLEQMNKNVMDPDGRPSTESGRSWGSIGLVLGVIGTVLGGLVRLMTLLSQPW
jgi:hypothetical protein